MASFTTENHGSAACIDGIDNMDHHLSQVEYSCDCALLMSFLDDNTVLEDWDDERLNTVMRSLEAEIQVAEEKNSFDHECKHLDDHEESSSSNLLNFNLMDMGMDDEDHHHDDEAMASVLLPTDHMMANWCMHGNFDNGDYCFQDCNHNMSSEDHEYDSCAPLWQEINNTSMLPG